MVIQIVKMSPLDPLLTLTVLDNYIPRIGKHILSLLKIKAPYVSIETTVFYHYNLFTSIKWSKYEGFGLQNFSKSIDEQLIPHHFGDP